ncbi:MAG: hypothetical protein LBL56_00370 [Treponema sp.]|jgi:hypothetical protein|nr:hypothetical protein [Treponema sp.]
MGLLTILILLILGFALLAFGYTLFFRIPRRGGQNQGKPGQRETEGRAGDPQTCPVCAARLPPGVLVKSAVYPSTNGTDRIMHIMGCPFCLEGEWEKRRPRVCPVCHQAIGDREYLFARVFERPKKSHVHVLGCINCRGPRAMK